MSAKTLYELHADNVVVWRGFRIPDQATVDRAAVQATANGWNGTELELWGGGILLQICDPSESALA